MQKNLPWSVGLRKEVVSRWDELISLRREFHKRPELSWKEKATSQRIQEWLKGQGIKDVKPVAGTGVVANIPGGKPGRTIMYRADIDALPVTEDSGVTFPSENPGVMHACGHDGHIAVGLMLASMVNQRRNELKGNVRVIFQPAEELGAGAVVMLKDGVMDNPKVDAVLGLHVAAEIPMGMLGIATGPTCAAVDDFKIAVLGKGGHAASPHKTVDPIVVGAQVVNALQTVVSRSVDPMKPAVVTVGTFHAGTKENIIADRAELAGTIRGFDMELMKQMPQRIEAIVKGVTESMGAGYEFHHQHQCPPVVNDAAFAERVKAQAAKLVGDKAIIPIAIAGADDMAYYLQKAPGCFFFLGGADAGKGPQVHHQPRFYYDDRSLALGLELSLRVIEEYLRE